MVVVSVLPVRISQMTKTLPSVLILEGLETLSARTTTGDDGAEAFKRRLLSTLLLCLDAIDSNDEDVGLLGEALSVELPSV